MVTETSLSPIATFHSARRGRYEVAHQGVLALGEGTIVVEPGHNFEQGLQGLKGFDRLWLVYLFHLNQTEDAPPVMVKPPRFEHKVGVFATRSPHRPNPIGITPARLLHVAGRMLTVAQADLLDQTPIVDIKPYLPFCDAFPEAAVGWGGLAPTPYRLLWSEGARERVAEIASAHDLRLDHYAEVQLQLDPTDTSRKRIRATEQGFALDFREWSLHYEVRGEAQEVWIEQVTERPEFPGPSSLK
ncbi:MAG: tRNA (N6-threonylcarbamoyladenosine(37)-N6)-methyltransferase TrmO [Deltaproteobacteria bacterium CG2_30_63_29]|nr:MAG: tRNA (N6-threonylcarbamoyladenosine(37)-N6)-methyltransferase TrmO [Deltaproteobacteria bacterium CG2_30_63_29]PJB33953.1 MAG: tRNA (N6-threonylcarbamoyladenosine(37)-N6)-methyltransferase TrmO [Deltaproteobacteria bacterium CG_4_9_14_3_um_filter_63_12]